MAPGGLRRTTGRSRVGTTASLATTVGAIDYFTHKPAVGAHVPRDLYEGEVPVERVGYYTQILADESVTVHPHHVQQRQTPPFFLSLHFTAPHWPWEGPEDEAVARTLTDLFHYDGGNLKTYATMVRALDGAVGQVLAALDAQGMADNTIVVFTSDNGGERFSKTWPFTGQKTELLEGGLRGYSYRAVDKTGQTIDFLLTEQRDKEAALRFLKKAIRRNGRA